jgi:hypothetical protein
VAIPSLDELANAPGRAAGLPPHAAMVRVAQIWSVMGALLGNVLVANQESYENLIAWARDNPGRRRKSKRPTRRR